MRALVAGEQPVLVPHFADPLTDNHIYGHEKPDEIFLSVVVVTDDASSRLLSDALVALDAQSDQNFELIVVVPAAELSDVSAIDQLLRGFSAGLGARSRVAVAQSRSESEFKSESESDHDLRARRLDAARTGVALARGHYLSILDASSVVFGHYVETFSRLAQTTSAGVLRARALSQPLRRLTWRGGTVGFEPTAGATSASVARFSVLEHLVAPATPPGSYALRREYFVDLGPDVDENEVLAEAAVLAGVHDAPDDVVVLLRPFEG
ncbi:MAG: hypothetical protein HIU57_02580 [Acidobacteria bacterium]|nr:hypothetical protein [Acidobacteriota bacterium]